MPITVKTIPIRDGYDEISNKFINIESYTLTLEYSLEAISEWESIYHKPFFSRKEKTEEESLKFIECMTISDRPPSHVYKLISQDDVQTIMEYIRSPMSACSIEKPEDSSYSGEYVSSETIYNNMIDLKIPFECAKWHYNRLEALMSFRAAKLNNQMGNNKMTQQDIVAQNRDINKRNKERLQKLKEAEK